MRFVQIIFSVSHGDTEARRLASCIKVFLKNYVPMKTIKFAMFFGN